MHTIQLCRMISVTPWCYQATGNCAFKTNSPVLEPQWRFQHPYYPGHKPALEDSAQPNWWPLTEIIQVAFQFCINNVGSECFLLVTHEQKYSETDPPVRVHLRIHFRKHHCHLHPIRKLFLRAKSRRFKRSIRCHVVEVLTHISVFEYICIQRNSNRWDFSSMREGGNNSKYINKCIAFSLGYSSYHGRICSPPGKVNKVPM